MREISKPHYHSTAAPWRRVHGRRPAASCRGTPRGSAGAVRRCGGEEDAAVVSLARLGRQRAADLEEARGAAPRGRRPSSAAWPLAIFPYTPPLLESTASRRAPSLCTAAARHESAARPSGSSPSGHVGVELRGRRFGGVARVIRGCARSAAAASGHSRVTPNEREQRAPSTRGRAWYAQTAVGDARQPPPRPTAACSVEATGPPSRPVLGGLRRPPASVELEHLALRRAPTAVCDYMTTAIQARPEPWTPSCRRRSAEERARRRRRRCRVCRPRARSTPPPRPPRPPRSRRARSDAPVDRAPRSPARRRGRRRGRSHRASKFWSSSITSSSALGRQACCPSPAAERRGRRPGPGSPLTAQPCARAARGKLSAMNRLLRSGAELQRRDEQLAALQAAQRSPSSCCGRRRCAASSPTTACSGWAGSKPSSAGPSSAAPAPPPKPTPAPPPPAPPPPRARRSRRRRRRAALGGAPRDRRQLPTASRSWSGGIVRRAPASRHGFEERRCRSRFGRRPAGRRRPAARDGGAAATSLPPRPPRRLLPVRAEARLPRGRPVRTRRPPRPRARRRPRPFVGLGPPPRPPLGPRPALASLLGDSRDAGRCPTSPPARRPRRVAGGEVGGGSAVPAPCPEGRERSRRVRPTSAMSGVCMSSTYASEALCDAAPCERLAVRAAHRLPRADPRR